MQKEIKNSFSGGLDLDSELRRVANSRLRGAVNVDVTEFGEFGALTPLAGTKLVGMVADVGLESVGVNVLGAFEVRALYDYDCTGDFTSPNPSEGGELSSSSWDSFGVAKEMNDSVVFFVWGADIGSRIVLWDLVRKVAHVLSDDDGLGFSQGGTVDAFFFMEKGKPSIYWIDLKNPLRKLVLKWSCAEDWAAPRLVEMETRAFFPRGVLGVSSVEDGGYLESGTYQVAYRLFDKVNCVFSAWSLFTNPMAVHPYASPKPSEGVGLLLPDADQVMGGDVGELSGKMICFELGLTEADLELWNWTGLQLAVVKHIDGRPLSVGKQVDDVETLAYLTAVSTDWLEAVVNGDGVFCLKGNEIKESLPLDEIVIEDAAIMTFKTLVQKDFRIFGGNVVYRNLEVGNIEFDRACSITSPSPSEGGEFGGSGKRGEWAYKNEIDYREMGHWRGELYRYGITYVDKYGNWSSACALDFSKMFWNRVVQDSEFLVTSLGSYNTNIGGFGVFLQGDVRESVNPGDWLFFEDAGKVSYQVIDVLVVLPSGNSLVWLKTTSLGAISPGMAVKMLVGQKGTHTEAGDWLFAERCMNQFCILGEDNAVNRLGLRIEGIHGHPSWAVGFAIVRRKRIKNILWQTPHIPTVGVRGVPQQFRYPVDGLKADFVYDGELDFFEPKKHIFGTARNIGIHQGKQVVFGAAPDEAHWNSIYRTQGGPAPNEPDDENGSPDYADQFGVPPFVMCVPAEYVANWQGEPFEQYLHQGTDKVEIVDAVQFVRKELVEPTAIETGSSAFLGVFLKSAANSFVALDWKQYFYTSKGMHEVVGTQRFFEKIEDVVVNFENFGNKEVKVIRSVNVVEGQESVLLPFAPFANNKSFEHIVTWNGGEALGVQQGSEELVGANLWQSDMDFGEPVESQRGVLLYLELALGDFTRNTAFDSITGNANYFPFSGFGWHELAYNNAMNTDANGALLGYGTWWGDNRENGRFACAAAYVLNCVRGLGDGRYGSLVDDAGEYIFTGVYVPLSAEDVLNDVRKDVDVWGGDCFVSKGVFKVSNSHAMPVPYIRQSVLGGQEELPQEGNKFWKTTAHEDNVEYLEMMVESEVNIGYVGEEGVYPQKEGDAVTIYSQPHLFPYNFDYSQQNLLKVWQGKGAEDICKDMDGNGRFPSRVIWSDLKMYNVHQDYDAFGRFRIGNVLDLEEEYGELVKLVKTEDNWVYAIQSFGIVPLPIGREAVELFDETQIVLGSGSVIGAIRQYVSTKLGSQHIRSVVNTGGVVYGVDAKRSMVWRLKGRGGVDVISSDGMVSYFNGVLKDAHLLGELAVQCWFDWNRRDLFVDINGVVSLYGELMDGWKSERLDFGEQRVLRGVFGGQGLYGLVVRGGQLQLWEFFAEGVNAGYFFGVYQDSSFTVVFNGLGDVTKVFDVLKVLSTERLKSVVCLVGDEAEQQPDQVTETISLDVKPQRHLYFVNRLRDKIDRSRLRGELMVARFVIGNAPADVDDDVPLVKVSGVSVMVRVMGDE